MNLRRYEELIAWFEEKGFDIDTLETDVAKYIEEVEAQALELLETINAA